MAKPKTVEWVNKALLQLFEVAVFLQGEFGQQISSAFVTKAFEESETLARYPEKGRPSKRFKTVRSVRLGKYHRMYYRVQGVSLLIIALFDTRQDPEKDMYR